MAGTTVWESICTLAGKDGDQDVRLDEVLARSAAGDEIAQTEIRQFMERGLIEEAAPGTVRLTRAGRLSCSELHGTNTVVTPARAADSAGS